MRVRLYGILFAVAAGVAIYYPYSPGGRQMRNMREADRYRAAYQPRLNADPSFADVSLDPITVAGGCLDVGGTVRSQASLMRLHEWIEKRKPQVQVLWHVYVDQTNANGLSSTRPQG